MLQLSKVLSAIVDGLLQCASLLSDLVEKAKKGYHASDAFMTIGLSKSIVIANCKQVFGRGV